MLRNKVSRKFLCNNRSKRIIFYHEKSSNGIYITDFLARSSDTQYKYKKFFPPSYWLIRYIFIHFLMFPRHFSLIHFISKSKRLFLSLIFMFIVLILNFIILICSKLFPDYYMVIFSDKFFIIIAYNHLVLTLIHIITIIITFIIVIPK